MDGMQELLAAVLEKAKNSPTEAELQRERQESTTEWVDAELLAAWSQIPTEYRDADIKKIPKINLNEIGFCLRGSTGIGKTYAATAIAKAAYRRLIVADAAKRDGDTSRTRVGDFVWMSVPAVLSRIRSTFGHNATETESDIVGRFSKCPVLVLDDLGAEKQTDFSAATLYTIISERRNWRRFTAITTNQTLAEIATWEPRLASRLAEMETVDLPQIDRRLRK